MKQWEILEGKKVNGAGKGYFEYQIPLPKDLAINKKSEAYFLIEASAKELFVKDQQEKFNGDQDYMKGDRVAPSSNPNSYPMTDTKLFSSNITVEIDGQKAWTTTLKDDPADHRGVLSWQHQLKDKQLREAGSYGYLLKIPISRQLMTQAIKKGRITVRLATAGEGGMAIYGNQFGRYMVNPCVVVR